jgi:Na+/H+ antiporter NhaD/arsenite permease-like protein
MIDFLLLHLDYIAMAFIILGYFRMGTLKTDGWIWTCLGSILLVIFGLFIVPDAKGVAIGNMVFIYLTARGFIKWRKSLKNYNN